VTDVDARTRSILARCGVLLTNQTKTTDWLVYATAFGFAKEAKDHDRLLRSQRFGDDDYPVAVVGFLVGLAERDPASAVEFTRYVLEHELDLEALKGGRSKDPPLVDWLTAPRTTLLPTVLTGATHPPPLKLTVFPNDFYRVLQEQINKCYEAELFGPAYILARAFLENLLIEILRKKYGSSELLLYFNPGKGRFQSFETLIANARAKLPDFAGSGMNADLLDKVNAFRKRGNASAHSIELLLVREEVEVSLTELENLVGRLFRVLDAL
jgi:hypothetical protein